MLVSEALEDFRLGTWPGCIPLAWEVGLDNGGKYSPLSDPEYVRLGACEDADDPGAMEVLRLLVETKLLGVCRGSSIFPGACILRAGLYVALGSCGIVANEVFKGTFPGIGGPPRPFGIPLGP